MMMRRPPVVTYMRGGQHNNLLRARAVAYINLDSAVSGVQVDINELMSISD
eukprot:COSAG01_NODE_3028_length_6703_cov_2.824955_3_plen_51_part_00